MRLVHGFRLVGKVAADNSHKWVFTDPSNEGDPSFISSWNVSIEPVSQFSFVCLLCFYKHSKSIWPFSSMVLIFCVQLSLSSATKGMGVSVQVRHSG